jgi:hypothetical protein
MVRKRPSGAAWRASVEKKMPQGWRRSALCPLLVQRGRRLPIARSSPLARLRRPRRITASWRLTLSGDRSRIPDVRAAFRGRMFCLLSIDVRVRGISSMASQSVARSESFAAFIPEFERLIAEAMDEWKVPGLAVAVVQNGEVAFAKAYGLRDVEAGLKVTTDTQFQLMSVAKSFTATGPFRRRRRTSRRSRSIAALCRSWRRPSCLSCCCFCFLSLHCGCRGCSTDRSDTQARRVD